MLKILIAAGLSAVLVACAGSGFGEDPALKERIAAQQRETEMRERNYVDSSYRDVERKIENIKTYSIDDIEGSAGDFRRDYCEFPIHTRSAKWYACQRAAELDSKIINLREEKVRLLVQRGTSEAVARRILDGDVRVGDEQMLVLESGKLKDVRQMQSASGLSARIEFSDGRVIYTRNGKVTSVVW